MDQQKIVDAYQAGVERAQAMVPGVKFVGATPEGEKLYQRDSVEHRVFMCGFLDGLPKSIRVDQNGIIA